MTANRRQFLASAGALAGTAAAPSMACTFGNGQSPKWARPVGVEPDARIPLWPTGTLQIPAGLHEAVEQRSDDPKASDRKLSAITQPRLDVFKPANPNGAAMIIAPGGGYKYVVIDKEGYELARLLRDRGVTVYVLFYRLPHDGWEKGRDVPLIDAQRAVRLVRSRAGADRIDPDRVTMMGFSAGGHVVTSLLTRFDEHAISALDNVDKISARPNGVAAIYPVVSMDPAFAHPGSRTRLIGDDADAATEAKYSPDKQVRADMPPLFLLHAEDDNVVPVQNSLALREAAIKQNVPCETHLFERGGHGFGLMKTAGLPVAIWPELLWSWMASHRLV